MISLKDAYINAFLADATYALEPTSSPAAQGDLSGNVKNIASNNSANDKAWRLSA